MLIARRNLMGGAPLPYDAEVEYLDSSGHQYIDTSIFIDRMNRFRIEIDTEFKEIPTGASYQYHGCVNVNPVARFDIGTRYNGYFVWRYDDVVEYIKLNDTDRHLFFLDCAKGEYGLDEEIVKSFVSKGYSVGLNFTLFADNVKPNGIGAYCKSKLYSAIIFRDGIVVGDFKPVRFTNESGVSEGAMYDRAGSGGMNPDGTPRTDGLYRNRGTGSFGWQDKNGVYVPPT